MNRLNYLQKFSLIGLLFLLPMALITFLLTSDIKNSANRVMLERKTTAFNMDLRLLIEHLQEQRFMLLQHGPLGNDNKYMAASFKLINEDMENVDHAISGLGTDWKSEATWNAVKAKWQTFVLHVNANDETAMINQTLDLAVEVNNYSGLLSDPISSKFNEGLLINLPKLLEMYGENRITDNMLFYESVKAEYQGVHDKLLGDTILEPVDKIKLQNQLGRLSDVLNQSELQVLSAGYMVYDSGISTLSSTLKKRADDLIRKKYFIVSFTTIIWLVLVYLFIGFYLSVLRSVYKLVRASTRLSNGDLSERVNLNTNDELQIVGLAYNKMAASMVKMLNERKTNEDKIKFLAYHDTLTGLPNRTLFNDRLGQALLMAARNHELVGVIFLDLDRFKTINDTFGHSLGDLLLQTMAERLKGCLRATDTVTRMGGDEFILILTEMTEMEQILVIAAKIQTAIVNPVKLEALEVFVSGSIGISVFPLHGTDQETLIRHADAAMYSAKAQGKNNFQLYDPKLNNLTQNRMLMELDLQQALSREEFILHYQPIIDVTSGQIQGVEALIRWQHPIMGLLYPTEFITLAEESGIIVKIGEWVLQKACMQNKKWQDSGNHPITMAVNISSMQFQREDFSQLVQAILTENDMDPKWLELELTESIVMRNTQHTLGMLQKLSQLGVCLSIDDFGTGFSSLGHLKRLPIHTLKIDKSFIHGAIVNQEDEAIVKTIISLGRRLNLNVVAEGVETEGQLAFLRLRKCNRIQGFLIGEPVPEAEMTLQLQSNHKGGL